MTLCQSHESPKVLAVFWGNLPQDGCFHYDGDDDDDDSVKHDGAIEQMMTTMTMTVSQ